LVYIPCCKRYALGFGSIIWSFSRIVLHQGLGCHFFNNGANCRMWAAFWLWIAHVIYTLYGGCVTSDTATVRLAYDLDSIDKLADAVSRDDIVPITLNSSPYLDIFKVKLKRKLMSAIYFFVFVFFKYAQSARIKAIDSKLKLLNK